MSITSIDTEAQKDIKKVIHQAYDLIESNFENYDQHRLTREHCHFVIDYVFSIYNVDSEMKIKVARKLKDSEVGNKYIYQWDKEDFKTFLIIACYGSEKRQRLVSVDDALDYIDIQLIQKIDFAWANINQKNQLFITKPQAVNMLKQLLKDYKINYFDVNHIVHYHFKQIYKYIFFEDYINIIISIHREFSFEKKTKSNKQKCGCSIF